MITEADLPALHTRQLLKALRMTRARNSLVEGLVKEICDARNHDFEGVWPTQKPDQFIIVEADLLGGVYGETKSSVTVEQLKAELATREHVPNKQESKALRQQKALDGKNKGRRDRR